MVMLQTEAAIPMNNQPNSPPNRLIAVDELKPIDNTTPPPFPLIGSLSLERLGTRLAKLDLMRSVVTRESRDMWIEETEGERRAREREGAHVGEDKAS